MKSKIKIPKYEIIKYNDFAEAAYLNKKHDPWVKRKEPERHYANMIISSCEHKDWWYAPFVGIEFFGIISYNTHMMKLNESHKTERSGIPIIKEVHVCQIKGVRIVIGRDISAKDITIV